MRLGSAPLVLALTLALPRTGSENQRQWCRRRGKQCGGSSRHYARPHNSASGHVPQRMESRVSKRYTHSSPKGGASRVHMSTYRQMD